MYSQKGHGLFDPAQIPPRQRPGAKGRFEHQRRRPRHPHGGPTLFEGKLNTFNTADAVYSQTSTDKQATRTAVEGRERAIIRRLKAAPGYTDAIGYALKIVGSDDNTDMTTAKVDLTATVEANDVALAFTKTKSDGINIYSKRDGDADYVYLAHDTISPYIVSGRKRVF